jgi:hypothetical protein
LLTPNLKSTEIQVEFADGSQHTLPVHVVPDMRLFKYLDESGIKDWSEVSPEAVSSGKKLSLQAIRFFQKVAADALSFPENNETWTVERIQDSFADLGQVAKIIVTCTNLLKSSKTSDSPKHITLQRRGPYG